MSGRWLSRGREQGSRGGEEAGTEVGDQEPPRLSTCSPSLCPSSPASEGGAIQRRRGSRWNQSPTYTPACRAPRAKSAGLDPGGTCRPGFLSEAHYRPRSLCEHRAVSCAVPSVSTMRFHRTRSYERGCVWCVCDSRGFWLASSGDTCHSAWVQDPGRSRRQALFSVLSELLPLSVRGAPFLQDRSFQTVPRPPPPASEANCKSELSPALMTDRQQTGGSHGPLLGLDEFAGAAHRTREDWTSSLGCWFVIRATGEEPDGETCVGTGLEHPHPLWAFYSPRISTAAQLRGSLIPSFWDFGKASLPCPDGLNYWLLATESTSRGQGHWKFQPSNHTVGSTGDQPLRLSGVQ